MQQSIQKGIFAMIFLLLFGQAIAQVGTRVSEDEVNTQKVFIDANREKILGNYENAAYLYKEVIKRDKKNHAAAYELARIYDVLDKDSKALNSIKMAISLEPDNIWYQMFLADVYDKMGKDKSAAKIYEELSDKDPNNRYYYAKWAFYLVKAKDASKAIKVYDIMEKRLGINVDVIRKKQTLYVGMGNNKKAAEELKRLIKAFPSNLEYRHDLAGFYRQIGEDAKAKKTYEDILAINPEDGKANMALVGANQKQGADLGYLQSLQPIFEKEELNIDVKIKELIPFIHKVADSGDKALASAGIELAEILQRVHPKEAKAYSAFGDLLYYAGQKEAALEKYQKAVELNNTVFTIWEQMMYIHAELGDMEALLETTEASLDVFPNQSKAYYFNGIAQQELNQPAAAVSSYQQALLMSRKNPLLQSDLYKRLGVTYALIKKYERSDEAFDKALELNADDYIALNNYSYQLAQRSEKLEKALKMIDKANQLQPNNAQFQDTYGWVFYKLRDYKKAKEWLAKALEGQNPPSASVLEHYGDVLFQLDDIEQALEYWQKAKERGGNSEKLDKKIADKQLYE
ncbi:MAG: tetratricopeptide repeat protein [Bacteroidota bacterium]